MENDVDKVIKDEILGVLDELGLAPVTDLNFGSVLLDSGLDSLGFAILVVRLEEVLGYDPFVLMDEPVYPRTLGEFSEIYQKYKGV